MNENQVLIYDKKEYLRWHIAHILFATHVYHMKSLKPHEYLVGCLLLPTFRKTWGLEGRQYLTSMYQSSQFSELTFHLEPADSKVLYYMESTAMEQFWLLEPESEPSQVLLTQVHMLRTIITRTWFLKGQVMVSVICLGAWNRNSEVSYYLFSSPLVWGVEAGGLKWALAM